MQHGSQNVVVRTVDTDVLVLCIAFYAPFKSLGLQNLWVFFDTGAKRLYLAAHLMADALGDKASAFPGFHAFTGCDTVSFFSYKGKKSAWKTWNSQSDKATKAFQAISSPSLSSIPDDVVKVLASFTVQMYNPLSTATNTDTPRKELFCSQNKPIHLIPPTSAALYQHILRAAYQAGQVWGRSYDMDNVTPSPKGLG